MASKSFVDLAGLTHYDEKLSERLEGQYVGLTGNQSVAGEKTFTTAPVLNQAGLKMTVKDTSAETLRTSQVLTANSSNGQYGINVALGSGGNCVVGGGEAGTAQLNDLAGNSGEDLYLVSDGSIYLKPNGNTWANAKTITLNASGELSGLAKVEAASFVGDLTGNVAGDVSGSSGSCTGNAATATKLATSRNINGTSFNGTSAITTANWGTARNVSISDADGTNTGDAVSVNGSAAFTLKLPGTIKASLSGNASTATTASKVSSSLILKVKSGTTEGTDLYTFNGSGAKTLDIKQGTNVTLTAAEGSLTIATKDTVYTHPTTSGNKHVPSGGSSGQFLGWDSDGTAKWVANPNSDTKNTAGSTDTSSKIFLVGATSQAANPQTYSHDTAYVGTDGCLYSGGTKVLTAHQSLANYLPLAGGTVTGTLVLSRNQDADPAADSKPALIVGGASTAAHIEIDANEVMAKGSGTTTAALYLNAGGGDIYLGGNTANYKSVTGRGKGSSTLPVYTDADGIVTACGTSLGVSITGNAATVTGTAGTSALSWNTETTLYTVGGNAIKAKLPANPNSDTKVKQYVGNTSTERPILSRYTIDEASQTANYVVYDTGVTNNPNKHTLTSSGGFIGKLSGTPEGTTYVAAVTEGKALLNATTTGYGGIWNAPTKNYRVGCSTYPSSGDDVRIAYSVTNANVTAGTNTIAKSLTWNADSGTLTATAFSGPLTGNVTGNVSGSSGSCTGNAATATKLATARTINGTSFDGSAAITTANWGTARDIKIQDSDGTNTGSAVSVNGSAAATLKLPATIKASITGNVSGSSGSCTGNAATATKLATARTINGVSFDGSANITVADSTKLPLAGGTMTGNITMSASKSVVFDLSATTPTASTVRNFPIQFKSQSTAGDFAFAQNPFWEIPSTQTANNGMGIGFGAGGLTIIGGGEAGKSIVPEESLTGTSEKIILASDNGIDFYTNCNTVANRVKTSIDTSGNFSGNSATATKLAAARSINIQDSSATNTGTAASFDGSGNATIKLPATIKATITGNCSGSSGSCTGNADTATKLATARTINGVSFDGSANITVADSTKLPLAGGTMTGSITLTDKSILFDNSTLDYNAAPSSNITQGGLYWRDKNDKYVARMLYYKNTDKTMGMSFGMCMHGTTNSDGYTTLLGMAMNADGSVKYASCPTPAAADNSTKIATTAFVNTKCGSYVPLSGGTMTGNLTMNGNSKSFVVKNDTYSVSLQVGSGGVNRGLWDTSLNKWMVYADASAVHLNGNAATATKLATARTINGVSFDGSANITVADSTKLPLAGGTLTGSLTMNGANLGIQRRNSNITKGTNPSANVTWNINNFESSGTAAANRLSCIEANVSTAGLSSMIMRAYANTKDATTNAAIAVYYDKANSVGYTYAPTPAAADSSTKIATTAWVRGRLHISTSNPSGGTDGDIWFKYTA